MKSAVFSKGFIVLGNKQEVVKLEKNMEVYQYISSCITTPP